MRSLSGKLRIGLAEQSVLYAIAQAFTMTPPGRGNNRSELILCNVLLRNHNFTQMQLCGP